MAEKTRYTDAELEEFRELIKEKLEKAKIEYELLRNGITNLDGNDVMDTSPTFKVLEEGAATLSKEEAGRMAQRQMKFIQHLQSALTGAGGAQGRSCKRRLPPCQSPVSCVSSGRAELPESSPALA